MTERINCSRMSHISGTIILLTSSRMIQLHAPAISIAEIDTIHGIDITNNHRLHIAIYDFVMIRISCTEIVSKTYAEEVQNLKITVEKCIKVAV